MIDIQRKNEPEIPVLFLSGKQREVHSSDFGFLQLSYNFILIGQQIN